LQRILISNCTGMKREFMNRLMTAAALILLACPAFGDDWPQWLGPTRDGVCAERVAPWKADPKVVWKAAVGEGHSSPIVAGGRVYIHVKAAGKEEEEVQALEATTGKEIWTQSYPRAPFESMFGHGPRATPLLQGDRLYTLGVTGVLTCWEAATGKKVWQVGTLKQIGA